MMKKNKNHRRTGRTARQQVAHIGKCAVLFLLSGFWFLSTINGSYKEFPPDDKLFVFAWVSLVCVFQLLFLLMIIRIKFLEWVCNISFATFAVINLFCLYLFFIVAVAALPTSIQVVLFVFSLFVAYSFFASLSVGGWWAKGVISIVGVLFWPISHGLLDKSISSMSHRLLLPKVNTSSPNIKIVDFKQKPNVYFISFDAMIPVSLAKKYLNIDNLSYQNFTKEKGFYRFRNAFSDGTYTRYGLNKLLAMDHDYFTVLEKQNKYSSLFVGLSRPRRLKFSSQWLYNKYLLSRFTYGITKRARMLITTKLLIILILVFVKITPPSMLYILVFLVLVGFRGIA